MADLNCPTSSNPNSDVEDLYPESTTPEDRREALSALCSFGHTPRLLTGIIKQILTQHFADPNHVSNSYLRSYLESNGAWTPDVSTGLYIESLGRWRPELTEKRPALVIKDGDWVWRRVGIGDQSGYDVRSGTLFYTGYWQGTNTVFAIGGEPAETQLLSAEVAKLLLFYGPLIMDQMELHRFVLVKLGALRALKESTENYVSAIDVAHVSEEGWKIQQDAPRLKRIVFDLDEFMIG